MTMTFADALLYSLLGVAVVFFALILLILIITIMNLFRKKKINPMVGAAGISAFPMASRVVQKLAQKEEPGNIILMHAAGANVAGQIASAVAGGLVIKLVLGMI